MRYMSYSAFYSRFYDLIDNIKESCRFIFRLYSVRVYLILFFIWQIIIWMQAALINKSLTGDLVALHYNVDFGIDLIAPRPTIFFYPILTMIVFILNLSFLLFLKNNKQVKIINHFLLGAAIFFTVLMSLVLLSVYLINFR